MDRRNPGARNPPRARGPGRTPASDKGEEGTPKKLWVGRPVASPRFSRPGLIGRDASSRSTTALRDPLRGHPSRDDLRGAFSALWARPARSGRGADVFGLSRPAPDGAFREEALQSKRPPESDATERPPRDRLPSACMTRCARGSSPEGSGGRGPWLGIDVKDYFLLVLILSSPASSCVPGEIERPLTRTARGG